MPHSTTAAGACLIFFVPGVGIVVASVLTVIANVAGQLGDLSESAVKDSSSILPRHGGFLDGVDSTLFSAGQLPLHAIANVESPDFR